MFNSKSRKGCEQLKQILISSDLMKGVNCSSDTEIIAVSFVDLLRTTAIKNTIIQTCHEACIKKQNACKYASLPLIWQLIPFCGGFCVAVCDSGEATGFFLLPCSCSDVPLPSFPLFFFCCFFSFLNRCFSSLVSSLPSSFRGTRKVNRRHLVMTFMHALRHEKMNSYREVITYFSSQNVFVFRITGI